LIRLHLCLPRSLIVAGARLTSRSYVLASLRALHLDLQLVASDQAAAQEGRPPGTQPDASARWGRSKPTSKVSVSGWSHLRPSGRGQLKAS